MLAKWVTKIFQSSNITLEKLSGDAGFRQYARFSVKDESYICVDAPPKYSNNMAFVAIANLFNEHEIAAPQVFECQKDEGFMCISDLGNELFSNSLTLDNMGTQYQLAIDELLKIARLPVEFSGYQLPVYDEAFLRLELSIFKEWLLESHLKISLSPSDSIALERCFEILIDSALEQPQVFMHRDYHSRNIMTLSDGNIGIIDFQDAVKGPITYDIVSLLRDCYVKWPTKNVNELFDYFLKNIPSEFITDKGLNIKEDIESNKPQWKKWFDLMGVQRHVKASGIFARLHYRDQKSGYLKDIPLTLSYIVDICQQYEELTFLAKLVEDRILPVSLRHPLHSQHRQTLEGKAR